MATEGTRTRILGIDLGTTNSAAAVWDGQGPKVIHRPNGSRLTPSAVCFAPNGAVLVGDEARLAAFENPETTITSAKRFIGRTYESAVDDLGCVAYEIVPGERGEARFLCWEDTWSPEQISGLVLAEIKRDAEAFLGERIDAAVITAPAHFNDAQRAATRTAAGLAGLEVLRILNEPTAAALAYGLDHAGEQDRTVVVYDFGGGTFDVSVLSVGEDILETVATRGDNHLGGDHMDALLAEWLLERFEEQHGHPADESAATLQRVREAAERAKVDLTTREEATAVVPFMEEGPDGPIHLEATITRAAFEAMVDDLVMRTLACCGEVLADARRKPADVDEVVLAGGATRIPLVRRRVAQFFGREPLSSVDPDVVVALGAAVQAGIIAGEVRGTLLVDVTSLSLGIEVAGGDAAVVIPRNTTMPVSATRAFTTSVDGQKAVQFHVIQGEHAKAARNHSLGRFVLDGIAPAPAGTAKIDVTFTIDINGMVLVSATDRATGALQAVTTSVAATSSRAAGNASAGEEPAPKGRRSRAAAPSPTAALAPEVAAVLAEAEALVADRGRRVTRVDRENMERKAGHLRVVATSGASPEEVEKARTALQRIVERVKKPVAAKRRS